MHVRRSIDTAILVAILLLPGLFCRAQERYSLGSRQVEKPRDEARIIDDTQVWSIACRSIKNEDDAPYVFLGTNDGLFVFNGARLNRYTTEHLYSIRGLAFDHRSDRLYAAGSAGYGWWDLDTFGNACYHPLAEYGSSLMDRDFWRVKIGADGLVYFQSHDKVCIYRPDTGETLTIPPAQHFRYMHESEGAIFVQDGNTLCGIASDGSLNTICRVEDRVMDIKRCGGRQIVALERSGLAELGDDARLHPLDAASNRILSEAKILSLTRIGTNHLLVGTTSKGIFYTDDAGRIVTDAETSQVLGNATVLSVECDANGDIWAGMEAGVARIDLSSQDYYLEDDRLGRVRAMAQLDDGDLLIGSNKGAFIWSDGVFRPVPGTTGSVWNVVSLGGRTFITHDLGLFALDEHRRAELLFGESGVLSIVQCHDDKNCYICGTYDGLVLLRDEGGRMRYVSRIREYDGFSRSMRVDECDAIWTRDARSGFTRLRLDRDKTLITERKDYRLVKSPGDRVFFSSIDGRLLLCCNTQAWKVDPLSGEPVPDEEGCRLLEACGDAFTAVQKGERWWYTGLSGCGIVCRQADGNFTHEGAVFRKAGQTGNQAEPCLLGNQVGLGLLGGIAVSGGPRSIRESLSIAMVEMLGTNRQQQLRMDSDRADIPFSMNSVRIHMKGNVREDYFEYRILPEDSRWQKARLNEPLQLLSLHFGNHDVEFRLKGAEKVACRLHLHIDWPWYLTGWMFAVYVLLISAIIFFIREYYKRKARKAQEHARLKAELKSRSVELANITFNSAQRKNQLNEIRRMLTSADIVQRPTEVARVSRETVGQIDRYLTDESDWKKSEEYFNIIYDGLLDKLREKYPSLSKTDLKICVYVKLNLSTKEIADLMNISPRSVEMARYRLRKRLGLPPGQDIGEFLRTLW